MKSTPEVKAAVQLAIDKAGGQQPLADALKVSQQAISGVLNGARWMPVAWARRIEALYDIPAASMVNPEKVL